jgi:hypothetical protein
MNRRPPHERQDAIAIRTFLVCGLILWAIWGFGGTIVASSPFLTILSDPNSPFPSERLTRIFLESVVLWSVAGAVMGISLCNLYRFRPEREHMTPACRFTPGRRTPGPKTEAELKTGFYGCIIGVILGSLLSLFPSIRLSGDVSLVTVKSVFLTVPISLFATVNVLQISLWYLTRRAERERW